MTIGAADIARARKHLGYSAARPSTVFLGGFPSNTDSQFIFEQSIQNLAPANEADVLRYLDTLDRIECRMIEAATAGAPAVSTEDVKINLDEPNWLEREYVRFAKYLAELIGCPVCPYAERFASSSTRMTANIRVG